MTPGLTLGDDGVATIRLNRPEHLNRLHRADVHALIAHFERLAPEELDGAVQQLVDTLAVQAPLAVRSMKLSLNELARGTVEPAVPQARVAQCAASDDLREGLAAFAERRAPQFSGR